MMTGQVGAEIVGAMRDAVGELIRRAGLEAAGSSALGVIVTCTGQAVPQARTIRPYVHSGRLYRAWFAAG